MDRENLLGWDSTPPINYVNSLSVDELDVRNSFLDALTKNTFALHGAARYSGHENVLSFVKEKLGRQKFTWRGFYRHHVWEGENWRIFVSNSEGIAFEVRENLTIDLVLAAYDDLLSKFGVTNVKQTS